MGLFYLGVLTMQVRILGAQKWDPESGKVSHKVWYSTDNSQSATAMELQDGTKATLSYNGEKPIDIKCSEDAFNLVAKVPPGTLVNLVLSPNPQNPRFNICTGLTVPSKTVAA